MQFRLRTLLIVLAVVPVVLAWGYREVLERQRQHRRERVSKELMVILSKQREQLRLIRAGYPVMRPLQKASPDEN